MSTPALPSRLGVLIIEDFLSVAEYSVLCSTASEATSSDAPVVRGSNIVDKKMRSTRRLTLSEPLATRLNKKFAAVRPAIERHFSISLNGHEELQLLMYGEGDFYRSHRDCSFKEGYPEYISRRQISAVVFLNSEDEGSYEGGALVLYDLVQASNQTVGIPVRGSAGTLVAFRSDVLHEVQPVIRGKRFSIVTWFYN